MSVELHKIFEPPKPGHNERVAKSVWVCLGPFDGEMWHAEDHPNAVALCRSAPEEIANEVADGAESLLRKLSIPYRVNEYPGD